MHFVAILWLKGASREAMTLETHFIQCVDHI